MRDLGKIVPTSKDEYSSDVSYEILDIVSYNGSSYICKQNNIGRIPDESPDIWMLLARKGIDAITPDIEMLDTSENAVQNKVIKAYIDAQTVTKVSDIENDIGYIDKDVQSLTNFYTKTAVDYIVSHSKTTGNGFSIVERLPSGIYTLDDQTEFINNGLIYFIRNGLDVDGYIFEEDEDIENFPKALTIVVPNNKVEDVDAELSRNYIHHETVNLSEESYIVCDIIHREQYDKFIDLDAASYPVKYDFPYSAQLQVTFIEEDEATEFSEKLLEISISSEIKYVEELLEYYVLFNFTSDTDFANILRTAGVEYEYERSKFEEIVQQGRWYTIVNENYVSKIALDEIAKVISDAPESFDTLKEIASWIESHEGDAATMNRDIKQNTEDISTINSEIAEINEEIEDISGKIDEKYTNKEVEDAIKNVYGIS